MRVFVTGATGFVGSAVVSELISAGHQVVGMSRSDKGAAALQAQGADVMRGVLADTTALTRAAANADGVIHCGFQHDWLGASDPQEVWKNSPKPVQDRAAIEALGAGLRGSDRPLLVTSGTAMLAPGQVATEETPPVDGMPRVSDQTALALDGVRASVVRLPPTVHGAQDHGFIATLIGIARKNGYAAYIGEGDNHWTAVHRPDAARLYRLALERGEGGVRYHAVAEDAVPFRAIAEAIGRGLNLPVRSLESADAGTYFGPFDRFAGMDARASSAWTRRVLNWTPTGPALIPDMETAGYFD